MVLKTMNMRVIMYIAIEYLKEAQAMQLRELTQALDNGKDVRWGNDGYTVQWETLPNGKAITIRYTANGFGGAMAISEIKDCYIKGEAQHNG